jgi:CPA2 family monovalent cation:H+ antiporter-2
LPVLATVLIILFGKSIIAFLIVRLFRYDNAIALTISASLAQIGEFSFILAGLGVMLGLLPPEGRDLVLAGAILTILLNPIGFLLIDRMSQRQADSTAKGAAAQATAAREPVPPTALSDHVILVGHGRVGSYISQALRPSGVPLLVIEAGDDLAERLKHEGIETIRGNAAASDVLAAANLAGARCLLVAIPEAFEGGQVVAQARAANPTLPIIARVHSEAEIEHFKRHGASRVVMGEHEIAKAMLAEVPPAKPADAAVAENPAVPA